MDFLYVGFSLEEGTDILSPKLVGSSEANRTLSFTIYDGETQATPTDPSDGSILRVLIVLKSRQV